MVVAVLLAPLIAVQVQKWLEHYRATSGRKMSVLQVLMATRNAKVSLERVRALNMIDLEFSGIRFFGKSKPSPAEQKVLGAWKACRDQLNSPYDRDSEEECKAWGPRSEELFSELLVAMRQALGYSYDAVDLRRDSYAPEAFLNLGLVQALVRTFLVELATGKGAIPMEIRQTKAL